LSKIRKKIASAGGRRYLATAIWAVLVNTVFYITLFQGKDLSWWAEYVKWHTYALGFVTGALTVTDVVLKKKES